MIWSHSRGSVVVQPIIDSDLVYLDNHNEVVGATWTSHHELFAEFVTRYSKGNDIYEIGGAHGLLGVLANKKKMFNWLIHDINPRPVAEYVGKIIQGKFLANAKVSEVYSTIVHSHTLEHVNDPFEFMHSISKSQKIGDRMLFSIPNMDAMISREDLNFLNFEHNYFLPRKLVQIILEKYGYEILEIAEFQKHSVFYATEYVGSKEEGTFSENVIEQNVRENAFIFDEYFKRCERKVDELNTLIRNFEGEKYVFGAHVFTQMLIAFGLETNLLHGCLDNSNLKENKRLYGTQLNVYKPESVLSADRRQVVIGSVATYSQEIMNQLKAINPQLKISL
jgi:hypothetical protein